MFNPREFDVEIANAMAAQYPKEFTSFDNETPGNITSLAKKAFAISKIKNKVNKDADVTIDNILNFPFMLDSEKKHILRMLTNVEDL